MAINLILSQSLEEFLRDPFLDLCCFCYTLMIYVTPRNCSVFTYLLMIQIYISSNVLHFGAIAPKMYYITTFHLWAAENDKNSILQNRLKNVQNIMNKKIKLYIYEKILNYIFITN